MDDQLRVRQGRMAGIRARLNPAEGVDWEQVYAEELPRVYNFFRYRVGDDRLAEDLTAATFERAWRAKDRYRRDRGAFATWLFSIARREAIDHFRARRDEAPLDALGNLADERPTPEQAASHADDLTRLRALLNDLPARDQELIALKYGAGLTNRAIAQLTGLTESHFATILHRAVSRLRAEWESDK